MGIWDRDEHEHESHKIVRLLESIDRRLARIEHAVVPHRPGPPVQAHLYLEGEPMGAITVPDNAGTSTATVTFTDAGGQATSPESPPVWSSSDESVATVDGSQDPSGLSAVVTVVGVGETDITAETTNNDGTVVSGVGQFTVSAGPPAAADVEFS
jgi:hypothetical protein